MQTMNSKQHQNSCGPWSERESYQIKYKGRVIGVLCLGCNKIKVDNVIAKVMKKLEGINENNL